MAIIYATTTGGIWSATSSWEGGIVPTGNDQVILSATAGPMTITGAGAVCNWLIAKDYVGTFSIGGNLNISDIGGSRVQFDFGPGCFVTQSTAPFSSMVTFQNQSSQNPSTIGTFSNQQFHTLRYRGQGWNNRMEIYGTVSVTGEFSKSWNGPLGILGDHTLLAYGSINLAGDSPPSGFYGTFKLKMVGSGNANLNYGICGHEFIIEKTGGIISGADAGFPVVGFHGINNGATQSWASKIQVIGTASFNPTPVLIIEGKLGTSPIASTNKLPQLDLVGITFSNIYLKKNSGFNNELIHDIELLSDLKWNGVLSNTRAINQYYQYGRSLTSTGTFVTDKSYSGFGVETTVIGQKMTNNFFGPGTLQGNFLDVDILSLTASGTHSFKPRPVTENIFGIGLTTSGRPYTIIGTSSTPITLDTGGTWNTSHIRFENVNSVNTILLNDGDVVNSTNIVELTTPSPKSPANLTFLL